MTDHLEDDARTALRALVGAGPTAAGVDFRDGQLEAIEALVGDRRRVLVVQRTGWGKSAVYFVATALLRAPGAGPTVLVSPAAGADARPDRRGRARRRPGRGDQLGQRRTSGAEVRGALAADEVDVLLVSPERLNNPRFRDEQLPDLAPTLRAAGGRRGALHQRLGPRLPPRLPAHPRPARRAARRHAGARHHRDRERPGGRPTSSSSSGAGGRDGAHDARRARPRLAAARRAAAAPTPAQRLGLAASPTSATCPGSGIIYTLTVSRRRGRRRRPARGRARRRAPTPGAPTPPSARALEQPLQRNEVKALVATSALGMGFDKPDLGFVVHLGAPSLARRLLPAGRPRRPRHRAAPTCCCCPGREDRDIWHYFATASMPTPGAGRRGDRRAGPSDRPCRRPRWRPLVDIRRTRLELLLKVLDVDGAVRRVSRRLGRHRASPGATTPSATSGSPRPAQREQQLMLDYEATDACRMAVPPARARRRHRRRPAGAATAAPASGSPPRSRLAAVDSPRAGSLGSGSSSSRGASGRPAWTGSASRSRARSRPASRLQPGRALARLTDLGWGQRLRAVLDGPDGAAPDWLARAYGRGAARAGGGNVVRWRWCRYPPGDTRSWSRRWPRGWPPSAGCRSWAR